MAEQKLKKELTNLEEVTCSSCGYDVCPVNLRPSKWLCPAEADQIIAFIKEALPELAKEAGYFREEAEWIESLKRSK